MKEYQQFPIYNFRTGFSENLEPWLLPRDAFQIMKNAHLYRGVLEKIEGYEIFAAMGYRKTISLAGTIDGANKVFTATLNPLAYSNNFSGQSAINSTGTLKETWTYDDEDTTTGIINLVSSLNGTGTYDTVTGDLELNFNTAPAEVPGGGNVYNTVTFTYDYLANPSAGSADIMGIKQYYGLNGIQEILVFDTRRVGKIISVDSILLGTINGTNNAITELPHEVIGVITPTPAFDGVTTSFTGTLTGAPLVPGEVSLVVYSNASPAVALVTATDNGAGALTGSGVAAGSYIDYYTGAFVIVFSVAPAATSTLNGYYCVYGDVFSGDYKNFFSVTNYQNKAFITNGVNPIRYYDGSCLNFLNTNLVSRPNATTFDISTCLHVTINRERLLLIYPTVSNVPLGNDIYWSTAGDPLDFTNDEHLPAPTSEVIRLFSFINTDMIVRFASSERVFRYTGDAFSPFRWDSTNNLWRCDTNYSAINYDSYFTSVGKPAIVGSDGVNVKRADEIIPDFTLQDRDQIEGPVISIQQTSIGQCYGERFDDFKEGWLCFKSYNGEDGATVLRSDSILSFNYLDGTYAVYDFPFNCLGFGSIISVDVWGNTFTPWGEADWAWASYFASRGAVIDLAGDRHGVVYALGVSDTKVDELGEEVPVLMDVITKNFNPFIDQGELCRFGYLDLLITSNAMTKLRVQFYRDDTMIVGPDQTPTGAYQETILTLTPTDSMSPNTSQAKVWKRIYVGAVAREHTIRFYQSEDDFTPDTLYQPVRIHSMNLYMKPAGRIFN